MYFKKTTIKVSPRHPEMRDFIERIPEVFEQEGQCVYIGRNVIKAFWIKVNGEDKEVMVKSPSFHLSQYIRLKHSV